MQLDFQILPIEGREYVEFKMQRNRGAEILNNVGTKYKAHLHDFLRPGKYGSLFVIKISIFYIHSQSLKWDRMPYHTYLGTQK